MTELHDAGDDDWPGFSLTPGELWAAVEFLERERLKMGMGEIPPGFRNIAAEMELRGQVFL